MRSRAVARRDERGYALVMFALILTGLMIIAAIVVDLGNARQQRQGAQGVADGASLSGAQCVEPSSTGTCASLASLSGLTPGSQLACLAAFQTAFGTLNQVLPTKSQVSAANCASGLTLTESGDAVTVTTPWQGNPDLVHVQACWNVSTTFGRIINHGTVRLSAISTAVDSTPTNAGFWLGTYAASITPLTNTILGGLDPSLGQNFGTINGQIIGYNGLASETVNLGALASAETGQGTVNEFSNDQVSVLGVPTDVTAVNNNGASATIDNLAIPGLDNNVDVGQYLGVDQGADANAAGANVNLYNLLVGELFANVSASNGVNAIDLSGNENLFGNISGLKITNVKATEGPQHYDGPITGPTCTVPNTSLPAGNACTEQLSGTLGGNLLNTVVPGLGNIGTVTVSVGLSGAAATERLTSTTCGNLATDTAPSFTTSTSTNGVTLPVTLSLSLAGIGLVTATATVVEEGGRSDVPVTWTYGGGYPNYTVTPTSTDSGQSWYSTNGNVVTIANQAGGGNVSLTYTTLGLNLNTIAPGTVTDLNKALTGTSGLLTAVLNGVMTNIMPVIGLNPSGTQVWPDPTPPACATLVPSLTQ